MLRQGPAEILMKLDLEELLPMVAARFGVDKAAILGRSRRRPLPHARHVLWAAFRAKRNWSYPRIADLFSVDHTSVLYACGQVRSSELLGLGLAKEP